MANGLPLRAFLWEIEMTGLFNGWVWVGGAAALTLAISCFSQLRALYKQLLSRVVVTLTISGYQSDAVLMYARQHFVASRFGPRAYMGWKLYFRPERRIQLMPMEVNSPAGRLYWRGWRPIWIAQSKEPAGESTSGVNADDSSQSISLTFARGTIDADRLIIEAAAYYNVQTQLFDATGGRRHSIKYIHGSAGMTIPQMSTHRSRGSATPTSGSDVRGCFTHRPLGFGFSDIGMDPLLRHQAVQRLALSDEASQLVEEVRRWRATERWHNERHLPWRRGFLLYGPPGTGKTALARAIAEDLDLPIHVFDLASLRNDELQKAWNQMLEEVPCMALMEDIDAVFHYRKNVAVTSGPGLTFDSLLNCLDGVQRTDGLLTVMTTNHLEFVDPAIGQPGEIGTRPGRIDRIVKLGQLDEAGRRKIALRVLNPWHNYVDLLCELGDHDTPAQFQERCARAALALHYDDQKAIEQLESEASDRVQKSSPIDVGVNSGTIQVPFNLPV